MRSITTAALAILGLIAVLPHPAWALFGPPDKSYGTAANWDIGYQRNIGQKGICYAHTNYDNGRIQIWIGSRLQVDEMKESWFLAIYDKRWGWASPNKSYRLNLLPPDKKTMFFVDFNGFRHEDGLTFLAADINVNLANALALEHRKGSVGVFSNDHRFLVGLDLSDSAAAIREVVRCRRDMLTSEVAHTEPSTQPSNTGSEPESKTSNGAGDGKPSERFGTGFFVAPHYVLTNMHVMKGRSEGSVKYPDYSPERAYIAGSDETNDLALLKTEMASKAIAAFRFAPRLGESSFAYGFPLPGLLSTSGNFTLGNVTALAGMNDDTRVLQTSTPVQPGNSGGPLLDDRAAVIGVVEKKLDAIMVASAIGDVPQNVNFAIQSPIAVNFLSTKSVLPTFSKSEQKLEAADIADKAKEFTVQVICK